MSPLVAPRRLLLSLISILLLFVGISFPTASHAASNRLDDTVQMRTLSITRGYITLKLGYCGNGSVNNVLTSVTNVVIVIHGDGRNACSYATSIQRAADRAGRESSTLVVAPHFPTSSDSEAAPYDKLYWSSSGWKKGSQSKTSPRYRPWTISSFEVVDILVDDVLDKRQLPNLDVVTITGHSAGGQFVNRYLATTTRPAETTPGVTRRWIVANPSSYLYLDDRRLNTQDEFETPSAEARANCPEYDNYKYGLNRRSGYAGVMSDSQIRARVAQTPVTYLIGSEDSDSESDSLDTSCAALLQGPERHSRAINYSRHLREVLPPFGAEQALITVDGVGHSARDMFTSPEGVQALFGHGPS